MHSRLVKVACSHHLCPCGCPASHTSTCCPSSPYPMGLQVSVFPSPLQGCFCVALINSGLLWWGILIMDRSQYPNTGLSLYNSTRYLGNTVKQVRILHWARVTGAGKCMTSSLLLPRLPLKFFCWPCTGLLMPAILFPTQTIGQIGTFTTPRKTVQDRSCFTH